MIFLLLSIQLFATNVLSAVLHIPIAGGGKPASPNLYPWVVNTRKLPFDREKPDAKSEHWCGASLLKVSGNDQESDIVLTAAHCIVEKDWVEEFGTLEAGVEYIEKERLQIVLGNHWHSRAEEGEEMRSVSEMEYHPKWKTGLEVKGPRTDVAVLKLNAPVKFSKTIQPVALPSKGETLSVGTQCTVVGWGDTKNGGEKKPDELYHLNVTIQDGHVCSRAWNSKYPERKFNKEVVYCAGNEDKPTVCAGDSGSPLTCKKAGQWVQFGIVSFGIGPCGRHSPLAAAYAKVEPILDWIDERVSKWSSLMPVEKELGLTIRMI